MKERQVRKTKKSPEDLLKLAESGDGNAMLEYSEYLRDIQNLKEAHEWHTKAAKSGIPKAMEEEGNFILYGWVEGNLTETFNYYKKAAESGYKKAYGDLGVCYLYGWGTEKNIEEAKICFKRESRRNYRRLLKLLSIKENEIVFKSEVALRVIRNFHN